MIKSEIMAQFQRSQYADELLKDVDISGGNFTCEDLSEIRVDWMLAKKAIFRGASFHHVLIRDGEFDGSNFEGATLEAGGFEDCVFSGCNFKNAYLAGAQIIMSHCTEACFDDVNFSDGSLAGSFLEKSSFRNANLSGIDASYSEFEGADLSGADLSHGNFKKANFTNAILLDVNWEGADLEDAIFDVGCDPRS